MQRASLILLATPCAALVDSRWLVTLKIGRVSDADIAQLPGASDIFYKKRWAELFLQGASALYRRE